MTALTDTLAAIGFYTLTDTRARTATATSPLSRCELLLTSRCNFHCGYCRSVGGRDVTYAKAAATVRAWAADGLRAIRFSGGEPTLYRRLPDLVRLARSEGVARIAVSTNGSAPWARYDALLAAGVDDFSVSLDACCAADGDAIAGLPGSFDKVVANIGRLSAWTYTTVGVVLTPDNLDRAEQIIALAAELGVHDIRVIPAAQYGARLRDVVVDPEVLDRYPVLAYRLRNLADGIPVRGLSAKDSPSCHLALDDMAVCDGRHYACIIHLREGGDPIGEVGPGVRVERAAWVSRHDPRADPICRANCLDVCAAYNRRYEELHRP
jgi:MoaA/NifB/PqqE/SkfB family radical SAM enzyme